MTDSNIPQVLWHRSRPATPPLGRRQWLTGIAAGLLAAQLPLRADDTQPKGQSGLFTFEDERRKTHEIAGRVAVETDDGTLLLEGTDGRLWTVPAARLQKKTESTTPFAPQTGEELGRDLVQTFKTGYQSFISDHYVICTNASDAYAKWCSGLLERLATAFRAYWKQRGVATVDPPFPLVALIFRKQSQFAEFATNDVGPDVATVPGYYSIPSNRIVLRDLTESTQGQPARTPEEIAQRLGASLSNVATIIHEATHQIAFNCGIHTRLADNPLWLTEGMAIYFEAPDLNSKTGWKTAGKLHRHRLQRFKEYLSQRRQPDALETLVRNDERLTNAETAEDAYAESWALTYFLIRKQAANYIKYLKQVSAKQPLAPATSKQRVEEFQAAFGDFAKLDADFLRYVKPLR